MQCRGARTRSTPPRAGRAIPASARIRAAAARASPAHPSTATTTTCARSIPAIRPPVPARLHPRVLRSRRRREGRRQRRMHHALLVVAADPPAGSEPNQVRLDAESAHRSGRIQSALIKGLFNVAPSEQLPINPSANGVHIYAEDASGSFLSVELAGRCRLRIGRWLDDARRRFSQDLAVSQSLRRSAASLHPRARRAVSASCRSRIFAAAARPDCEFEALAKDATLLHHLTSPLTLLQVDLTLAAQPAPGVASPQAEAGQCAEALFTATRSRARGNRRVVEDEGRRSQRRDLQGKVASSRLGAAPADGGTNGRRPLGAAAKPWTVDPFFC